MNTSAALTTTSSPPVAMSNTESVIDLYWPVLLGTMSGLLIFAVSILLLCCFYRYKWHKKSSSTDSTCLDQSDLTKAETGIASLPTGFSPISNHTSDDTDDTLVEGWLTPHTSNAPSCNVSPQRNVATYSEELNRHSYESSDSSRSASPSEVRDDACHSTQAVEQTTNNLTQTSKSVSNPSLSSNSAHSNLSNSTNYSIPEAPLHFSAASGYISKGHPSSPFLNSNAQVPSALIPVPEVESDPEPTENLSFGR